MDGQSSRSSAPRKRRRPALACEQCRRKKIRCDCNSPCGPCAKANFEPCTYVHDERQEHNSAPFEPHDTQFSVFGYTPRRTSAPSHALGQITFEAGSNRASQFSEPENTIIPGTNSLESARPTLLNATYHTNFLEQNLPAAPVTPPPSEQQSHLELDPMAMLNRPIVRDMPRHSYLPPTSNIFLRGAFFKTRLYGHSHWINILLQFPTVLGVISEYEADDSKSGYATFATCKSISRTIKAQENTVTHPINTLIDMMPSQAVCDSFVQAYLRTFQTVFGILHLQTFCKDYKAFWIDSTSVDETFQLTLLLVMCIGSAFWLQETAIMRATVFRWISAASTWLSQPKEKPRLNLDTIRIHCLMLLARQVSSVGGDITWLSTGSLLRMAMHMGLHIDPENHPFLHISSSEIESRRRLWATILELEVQSSMDSGGLPSISIDDYDCALPSNIDDTNLEAAKPSATAKNINQYTQSSIQILLLRSMPVRLKILRLINSLRSECCFETALSLTAELSEIHKDCSMLIHAYSMSSTPPTAFQAKLFDLYVLRFFLALHHPFAIKAISNPSYYYSRKICVETSLSLFSKSVQSPGGDFYCLILHGSGSFRDVYTQGALYMCGELGAQLATEGRFSMDPSGAIIQNEMRKAINKYLELAIARIEAGEKSIKSYIYVSCLLAQANATHAGTLVEQKVKEALKKSIETCYALLSSQVEGLSTPVTSDVHDPNLGLANFVEQLSWTRWDDLMSMNER